jgi:hypothetical protein
LEQLLRDAVERWTSLDGAAREKALDAANADHIGNILLEALLQKQSDLLFEQLFREEALTENESP